MEDGSSRGRGGGAHGLLNQLIKLTYELATENGQKWGAEAGNRTLGLGNRVILLRVLGRRKRLYACCWLGPLSFLPPGSLVTWGMCLSVGATVDRNTPFGPYSGNRYNLVLLMLLFVCICHGN